MSVNSSTCTGLTVTTVRPFGPYFRGQKAKCLITYKNKWSACTIIYKTVNLFKIGWAAVEKSRPELDPKLTRLSDLLPTGNRFNVISSLNVKTIADYVVVNFKVASYNSFRDILKNNFVTAEATADIDDCIKHSRFTWKRLSNKVIQCYNKSEKKQVSCKSIHYFVLTSEVKT